LPTMRLYDVWKKVINSIRITESHHMMILHTCHLPYLTFELSFLVDNG